MANRANGGSRTTNHRRVGRDARPTSSDTGGWRAHRRASDSRFLVATASRRHSPMSIDRGPVARCQRLRDTSWPHMRASSRLCSTRVDAFAAKTAAADVRLVITHGEPHPGNLIRTGNGLAMVDWDTVALAPRERDLWMLADDESLLDPLRTRHRCHHRSPSPGRTSADVGTHRRGRLHRRSTRRTSARRRRRQSARGRCAASWAETNRPRTERIATSRLVSRPVCPG